MSGSIDRPSAGEGTAARAKALVARGRYRPGTEVSERGPHGGSAKPLGKGQKHLDLIFEWMVPGFLLSVLLGYLFLSSLLY